MTKIAKMEWAALTGQRPRSAGSNARLGTHGRTVQVPLVRLTADDGSTGFGWSRVGEAEAATIVGAD